MVAPVAAQVEEAQARGVHGVAQHLHRPREALEHGGDHEVREPVVDAVDLHAARRRVGQRLLEPLAGRVALPDVGLEEDLLLRALDRGEHVVVEVLTVGVGRHGALADRHLRGVGHRELARLLAPPPVGVDQRHADRQRELHPDDGQQRATQHPQPPLGPGPRARHEDNLVGRAQRAEDARRHSLRSSPRTRVRSGQWMITWLCTTRGTARSTVRVTGRPSTVPETLTCS